MCLRELIVKFVVGKQPSGGADVATNAQLFFLFKRWLYYLAVVVLDLFVAERFVR